MQHRANSAHPYHRLDTLICPALRRDGTMPIAKLVAK
jgi:hypothetical protein